MIKYIKMFTLIILVTLLSGCTLENIFNRENQIQITIPMNYPI